MWGGGDGGDGGEELVVVDAVECDWFWVGERRNGRRVSINRGQFVASMSLPDGLLACWLVGRERLDTAAGKQQAVDLVGAGSGVMEGGGKNGTNGYRCK